MDFDTTKDIVFTAPDGVSKTTITAAEMATAGVSSASNAVEVSLLANKKFQTEGVDLNLTVVPAVAQAYSTDFTDANIATNSDETKFTDTSPTGSTKTLTITAVQMQNIKTVSALALHINTNADPAFTLSASVSDDATPTLVLTLKTPAAVGVTPSDPTSKIGHTLLTHQQTVAAVEQSFALESAELGDHTAWATLGAANIANVGVTFAMVGTAVEGQAGGPMGADISAFITSGMDASLSNTLGKLDTAIEGVATQRATFGATMNRLTSVVDNLASAAEATSTARGRIEDANYASETTALARSQIISQAGTAMLAQANQKAQSVLSLLQ
jgi:flagellin